MADSYSFTTYPYKWMGDCKEDIYGPLAPVTNNLRRRPIAKRDAGI